jgi:hypothetical protein
MEADEAPQPGGLATNRAVHVWCARDGIDRAMVDVRDVVLHGVLEELVVGFVANAACEQHRKADRPGDQQG